MFGIGKKPKKDRVENAQEARDISKKFLNKEIKEVLSLIAGFASSGKESVAISKELEPITITALKQRGFMVVTPHFSKAESDKYVIKW